MEQRFRQISYSIIAVLLCLLASVACPSANAAERRPLLHVGLVQTGPAVQEQGFVEGLSADYIRAVASYAGMDCVFFKGTALQCQTWLDEGKVDVISDVPNTHANRQRWLLSWLPMGSNFSIMFVHGGWSTIAAHQQSGIPLRLGHLRGDGYDASLPSRIRYPGITYHTVAYDSLAELTAEYDDDLDCFFVSAPLSSDDAIDTFDVTYGYMAVRQDEADLMARLNRAADDLRTNRPDFLTELRNSYPAGRQKLPLMLTGAERDYLAKHPVLRVVAAIHEKPFAYMSEDGQFQGMMATLLDRMASDLGVEFEVKPADTLNDCYLATIQGDADINISMPFNYSWAAQHGETLSAALPAILYTPVSRRSMKLEHPIVACIRNSFVTRNYLEKSYPVQQRLYFDTPEQCLQALADGRADITYVKASFAQYSIWKGDYPQLMISGDTPIVVPQSLGFAIDTDPRLISIIDKELAHIGTDDIQAMDMDAMRSSEHGRSLLAMLYAYPTWFVLGACLAFIIITFLLVRMMHMRQWHLSEVKNMLFTDHGTGLHARVWLEQEAARQLRLLSPEERRQSAMIVLLLPKQDILISNYGLDAVYQLLRRLASALDREPWITAVAVRSGAGQIQALVAPSAPDELTPAIRTFLFRNSRQAHEDYKLRVSLVAGVCYFYDDDMLPQAATAKANIAAHNTDCVRIYDKKLSEQEELRQKIESNMERALENGEFQVWYQPKYDIVTRKCVGAEALVRWQSPELGFLMPGQFIDTFERSGFVTQLDYYMLEHTFKYQQERRARGLPVVPISVNQSRLHFDEDGYLAKMQGIASYFGHLEDVELEITETAFDLNDERQHERAVTIVRRLKKMGFTIDMDDFGSGYSDLSLLTLLPMDVMKLDRSILSETEDSERMQIVLTSCVTLGKDLGMKVICEGIETHEQEQLLLACGCCYGQGYLNSKPLPEHEFTEYLAEDASASKNT